MATRIVSDDIPSQPMDAAVDFSDEEFEQLEKAASSMDTPSAPVRFSPENRLNIQHARDLFCLEVFFSRSPHHNPPKGVPRKQLNLLRKASQTLLGLSSFPVALEDSEDKEGVHDGTCLSRPALLELRKVNLQAYEALLRIRKMKADLTLIMDAAEVARKSIENVPKYTQREYRRRPMAMLRKAYEDATGKDFAVSRAPGTGQPGGPAVRFVAKFYELIGVQMTLETASDWIEETKE